MMKKSILAALVAFGLGTTGAHAAGGAGHIEDFAFSFEGPFGTYDPMQLQRGLKIYTEVCASCHGVNEHDQAGNPPPQNEPEARRTLLQYWQIMQELEPEAYLPIIND